MDETEPIPKDGEYWISFEYYQRAWYPGDRYNAWVCWSQLWVASGWYCQDVESSVHLLKVTIRNGAVCWPPIDGWHH